MPADIHYYRPMIVLDDKQLTELRCELDDADEPERVRALLIEAFGMSRYLEKRRILEVGDLPIHCELYESRPEDPVVLFVPGIGTYSEMYCEFLHELSRERLNVVGVDVRGHGRSGGPRGLYRVEEVARDLSEVITRLEQDFVGPFAVFGSSIGSVLGLACAEKDERVRALLCHTLFITECPPDLLHLIGWNWVAWSRTLVPHVKLNLRSFLDISRLLQGNHLGQFARYDDLIVWDYPVETLASLYTRRTRAYTEELGFRGGVIIGDSDEIIDLSYERFVVRRMRHPFDLILIPGGRHMLPFDRPDAMIRAAGRWLRSAA